MKKLLFACIMLFPLITYAQTGSANERYCYAQVSGKMFTKKLVIHVDYGTDSLAVSLKPKQEDEILKNFTNGTDFLNYMAQQGWKLVSTATITDNGITSATLFFFRREI